MKSRTSFFNPTVLGKNITRFAPAWALYSVFLLMFMVLLGDSSSGIYYADNLAQTIAPFAIINFFYALLCAQLLFGDLYNSRMCNALHAMPLRREIWFMTNVVSGLLFSFVPNAVFAMITLPLTAALWPIPLLWLAAATLQYLFFFGTAVLASYCVGNRFAMGLVYIIINGFSLILYWLVETLYAPVLYGVVIQEEVFFTFSPLVKMVGELEYLTVEHRSSYAFARWYLEEGWGYLGVCAVLGIACMILALLAYRRRDLECAGDFIAIKWLGPVFLVLYTLCGGACCHGFFSLFIGEDSYFFLILGFIIGFFTGRMLLERTVRVFRKKNFLAFSAFLLAFSLSFLAVQLDVLGIVRWVPKASQVKGVALTTGGSYYYSNSNHLLTDKDMIEDVLMIHKHGIDNRYEGSNGESDVRLFITYHMSNGTEKTREYYIDHDTEAGRCLKAYMSSPEMVLGGIYTEGHKVLRIMLPDISQEITDSEDIQSLLDAIVADAQAGSMGQDWNYTNHADYQFWLEAEFINAEDDRIWRSIRASSDCQNILAWLEDHGIFPQEWESYKENLKYA